MEKADAERLVHAVWHSKRDFEAAHGVRITLPDYLAVYLQVRQPRHRTVRQVPCYCLPRECVASF